MQFGFIAPTSYLPATNEHEKFHLCLAHLVQSDLEYINFYQKQAGRIGTTIILDNSGYELYKAGLPMLTATEMIQLGSVIKADYLVLPDYPGEPAAKTRGVAVNYANAFKAAGFGTFYVPQSSIGAYEELIDEYLWALHAPEIDYIGISILSIPNASGVEDNPLQRFVSRFMFMQDLNKRCLIKYSMNLQQIKQANDKQFHFLGMLDGPYEIKLMEGLVNDGIIIDTWDSSSPIWSALCGVEYDASPTGIEFGKVKEHVVFGELFNEKQMPLIKANMAVIRDAVTSYNNQVKINEHRFALVRFNEHEIIESLHKYIVSTYTQHYALGDESDLDEQIQAVDIWKGLGSLETTARDTALKYLLRFGKKEGKNSKDLLKAMHYVVLILSQQRGFK